MRRYRPERPRSEPPALVRFTTAALIVAMLAGGWIAREQLPFAPVTPPPFPSPMPAPLPAGTFVTPLTVVPTDHGPFESCPDPAIIRGQQPGDPFWYMYCTMNPLNGNDRGESGRLNYHLIPILQSADLVHWTYVGDVFTSRPAWLSGSALLWTPEIQFFNGRYYLDYTATGTRLGVRGSAIGVATSTSPTGPWTDSDASVVEPQPSATNRRAGRSVYDPAVVTREDGQRYLFYGGFDRIPQVSPRYPRLGSAVVGPPALWTYLRIVKHTRATDETYTAYTSQVGVSWVQGTTWTRVPSGSQARIGLVAMGGAGFTANFDYLRVSLIPPAPMRQVDKPGASC